MKDESRRTRRRAASCVALVALVAATSVTRVAGADPSFPAAGPAASPAAAPAAAPAEPEPRCHRDRDLACTLVRETPGGVWVFTERFRPADAGNSGWTLAVGAGPASPGAATHFVATTPPPARPTPNGAPILE